MSFLFRAVTRFVSFTAILCLPLLFVPCAFSGEKTVGVIMTGDIPHYREAHGAFLSKLGKGGYAERVETIVQRPYPDPFSMRNAVRKLVALDVDVIIAYGAPAMYAIFDEKPRMPVVFSALCGTLNLDGKGKNITGVCSKVSVSSLLRYLRGIASITTLGVVFSTNEEDSVHQLRELRKLSQQHGFELEEVDVLRPQDAKAKLSGKKLDAVLVTSSSIANMAFPAIQEFARDRRIPTASLLADRNTPATISLSANPREQGEAVAEKVLRIFNGTSPEMIRRDSSGDAELVFNLREARTSGFRIPMELVSGATRLIE